MSWNSSRTGEGQRVRSEPPTSKEETMYENESLTGSTDPRAMLRDPREMTMVAESDVKRLSDVIEDVTMLSEKTLQMVNELMKMLEPVRHEPGPEKALQAEAMLARIPYEFGSPYAARLYNAVDRLKTAQSRIALVMGDLDVQS
jgi:hypothetical protein